MKTAWEGPHAAVCDNVEIAKSFISKAEQAARGIGDIRLRWCLNIAAGGLWSAVEIFDRKVATSKERFSKTKPSDWFTANEPLVPQIRNGAVHYKQPHGVGQSFSPGSEDRGSAFVWIGGVDDTLLVEEVLSRLNKVAERIEQQVKEKSHSWRIAFG